MKGFINIAFATASQARREPIYYILTAIFALLVYASQYFVLFVFQGEAAVVMETGVASISACGFLLALFLSWLLIRKEMERMSILTVLSKPVSRFSFLAGKYTGLMYAIFLSTVFLFLMFCLNLWQFDSSRVLNQVEEQLSVHYQKQLLPGGGSSGGEGQKADAQDSERALQTTRQVPSGWKVDLLGAYTGLKLFAQKWIIPGIIATIPAFLSIAIILSICTVCSLYFEVLPTIGFTIAFLILGSLSGSLFEVLAVAGDPGLLSQISGWLVHLFVPDLFRLNIASSVGSQLHISRIDLVRNFGTFLASSVISVSLFVGFVLTTGTVFFQRKEIL